MKHKTLALLSLFAFAFCTAVQAAEVQAKIVRANGDGSEMPCLLRWLPADKQYVIVNPKTKAEMRAKPSEIASLVVARPRNWQELAQKAAGRAPESALSGLKALAAEYRMLQWDAEAGRLIAEILLRKNQYDQAVKECEEIVRHNPAAAYDSPMAPVYWEALIAADGYLRCVFLFPREADARAEALFKAAQTFDQLHKATYAEKMRQQLLTTYGNSKWAREASGAGH